MPNLSKLIGGLEAISKARAPAEDLASKAIGKAAQSAGMNAPITANKNLTNIQDFHQSMMDELRQRVANTQNLIESTPFKYDVGQKVFTDWSANNNKPPYEIVAKKMVGNRIMRAEPNEGEALGKPIINPETGKAYRTPMEPGYLVRHEPEPGQVMSYSLPESILKGPIEPEEPYRRGGPIRMGIGGGLNAAEEAYKAAQAAKMALSTQRNQVKAAQQALEAQRLAQEGTPIKASEALGKYEGSYLKTIPYDRMKVDLSAGKFGGPGFSGIQQVDPNYANAAAGVTDQKSATRVLNRNANVPQGANVIWTPAVGGLEQHKSNTSMFGKFADMFAAQRANMDPEHLQLLNDYVNNATFKSGKNAGKLIFPEGIDLSARNFRNKVSTYDQRGLLADVFAGRGVGGEKGRTVPVENLLQQNLDPNMAEAPTGALGNRLFNLSGDVMTRPDLHPDYPKILTGEDLNVNYLFVPREFVMQDFAKQIQQAKGRPVTDMDYRMGDPTQFLSEDILTNMQKEGHARGGRIHLSLKNPKLKEHIQAFGRGGGAHSDAPLSDAFTKGLMPMLAGASKGAVSGILGAPGDLESMGRSAINALAPQESVLYESNKVSPETFLPTSESIANRLPMLSSDKTAQQVEKFGTSAGSNIAGAMVGPETLLKGKAIGSLADKLKSALNNSGKIKPLEKAYATTQDGPFYRVTPTSVHPSEAVDSGTRQKIWGTNATPDARTARESGSRDAASFSHEALKDVTNDPVQNLPWYLANKKVNEIHGRDYQEPKMPPSSLVKQGPIARAFMAGANNEPGYKEAVFKAYQEQHPELVKQAGASNYDELLKASYEQLAKETKDQFNSLPYEFSFHRNGEGNYPSSAHMAADVHGNGHIYVYQGGDKHDFLHEVDPETGLNTNEMFRAVHDVFGHAIHGNQFGPKGEEIAWGAHQQMYSPLAVPAMSAETRGQNSVVNYSPLNAELKKDVNNLEERIQQIKWKGDTPDLRRLQEEKRNLLSTQFQYAPQASVLLPPEMLRPEYNGGMPEYLKPVIKPNPETTAVQNLYHFSHEPNLTETNPNRYGTGIKGAEAQRLEAPNAIKPRTYFYTDPSVTPEAGLGPYKYQSQANDLYNLQADPLKFYTLARETGREPFTAKVNAGVPPTAASVANDVERLANEYGYSGVYDPSSAKPAAAVFNPMPVQRQKRGGLAKENFNG